MIDRLPNSEESERTVLGAVFLDEGAFPQIAGLPNQTFYTPTHREAFCAMKNLFARNEPINPVSVLEEARQVKGNSKISTIEMTQWTHGVPYTKDLSSFVAILKDRALKRDLIQNCAKISNEASEENVLAAECLGKAVTSLQSIYTESLDKQKPTVSANEAIENNHDRWAKMLAKEIVTIETGMQPIDDNLTGGGLEKGMFHVIGARPGKGKTSFGLDMVAFNAFQGKVCVFFTMELSRDVLVDRFVAPLAGVPRWKISSKWMDKNVFGSLMQVQDKVGKLPLYFNHKARDLTAMRLALKEVEREKGKIDLVVVDFLTKMKSSKGTKYEAVSDNANGLAEFAVEFNSAVVALAQLNREVTKRENGDGEKGKVKVSDFRDSGEIEELGRTIFGLWGEDESSGKRDVRLSCLKQGEGSTFDVALAFDTDFMTFGVRQNILREVEEFDA